MARNPPVDLQDIAGAAPSAANPLPVKLVSTLGAFYDAGGGAGGGGGAATIADGADVAEGSTADVAWVGTGSGSLVAISKAEYAKLEAIRALLAGTLTVGTHAVTGPLTDAQLRAAAVPVSGPLTDAQLRASAVPVSGFPALQPVSDNAGSLTVDAPVGTPVFVRLSDGTAAIATLPVSGPLTDTQLRAAAVPVSMATQTPDVTDRAARLLGHVTVDPQTANGLTISRVLSAASTNATSVKASAGQVYGWYIYNANAAVRYLKLYNKASAPTVGTDIPVMTIPIPPASAANVEFTMGIAFATGIALALTTGVADADVGAVAATEIVVNLLYK